MTDEVEQGEDLELLEFRRFPKEKQDQVRALVNYATLMGLTGKDLVSIGGKLDRIKASREKKQRNLIADEMIKNCELIGKDKNDGYARANPRRFVYTDSTGRKWRIEGLDFYGARITSDTGKAVRVRFAQRYDISGGKYDMKQCLLNIHDGHVKLNF